MRLFAEAFAQETKLADERPAWNRYNAACAASLAAYGLGKEKSPDTSLKTKLRQQALEWLKAELGIWARIRESGTPEDRDLVAKRMTHWKTDSDLASIRDAKELAKLPEDERAAFQQLWSDVDGLLTKTAGVK